MQLHRISLYLAIEGPPNLGPRPSLLCPWSPGSSAVSSPPSSPGPVQSQTRRSAAPASTVDILHLNLHCTLEIPPPPRLLPPLLPTAAHPLSHFTTGFKTALLCRAVVSLGHRRSSSPLAVPAWAIANHTRTPWVQHGTPYCSPDINQPGPNVRQPPAVRLTPAVCLNHPSFLVRFGPSPANPHPVLVRYNPRRSLAPRAALSSASRLCRRSSATASRESSSHRRDPPHAPDRPPLVLVLVTAPAAKKKVGRRQSIACPLPPSLLQEPAHATLRETQDRHDVHSHAAEGRR